LYDHFNLVLEYATRKIATKPGGIICNRRIGTWPMQMTVIIGRTQVTAKQTYKELTNATHRLGFPIT